MRRTFKLSLQLVFLFSSLAAAAQQFTQVSGTVIDPHGTPYSNGTIAPHLVISGSPRWAFNGLPYTPPSQPTGLDATGHFIMSLADVNALIPTGGTWNFTVCAPGILPPAGFGPVCFTSTNLVITGTAMDISAVLQSEAPPLSPGAGGGGGTTLQVNGGPAGALLNMNSTTPPAPVNGKLINFQISASNMSAYLAGSGNSDDCLKGTGDFEPCPGGGGGTTVTVNGTAPVPPLLDFNANLLPPASSHIIEWTLNGNQTSAFLRGSGVATDCLLGTGVFGACPGGGGGGSGTVANGIIGQFASYTATNTVSGNPALTDTSGIITATQPISTPQLTFTGGSGNGLYMSSPGGNLPTIPTGSGAVGIGPGGIPQFNPNGTGWVAIGGGGGTGGGTAVSINGTAAGSALNIGDSGVMGWTLSGGTATVNVQGTGNATDCLLGTGSFGPCPGVTSINAVPGAFTFTGAGVSCVTTTCTFTGGGGGAVNLTQGAGITLTPNPITGTGTIAANIAPSTIANIIAGYPGLVGSTSIAPLGSLTFDGTTMNWFGSSGTGTISLAGGPITNPFVFGRDIQGLPGFQLAAPPSTTTPNPIAGMSSLAFQNGGYPIFSVNGGAYAFASSVQVNGTAGVQFGQNFNNTNPVAPANGINVTWASAGGTNRPISAAVVGDGVATDCLIGTGTFAPCPATGGGGIGGSGTAPFVPVFTGATTLGTSNITSTLAQFQVGASPNFLTGNPSINLLSHQSASATCSGSTTFPLVIIPPSTGCVGEELQFANQAATSGGLSAGLHVKASPSSVAAATLGIGISAQVGGNLPVTEERAGDFQAFEAVNTTVTTRRGLFAGAVNETPNVTALNEAVVAQTGVNNGSPNTSDYTMHVLPPLLNPNPLVASIFGTHAGLKIESTGTGPGPAGPIPVGVELQLGSHVFANLPTCATNYEGSIAAITDASGSSPVTGGGTGHTLVYCNGTNWAVVGGGGGTGTITGGGCVVSAPITVNTTSNLVTTTICTLPTVTASQASVFLNCTLLFNMTSSSAGVIDAQAFISIPNTGLIAPVTLYSNYFFGNGGGSENKSTFNMGPGSAAPVATVRESTFPTGDIVWLISGGIVMSPGTTTISLDFVNETVGATGVATILSGSGCSLQ